MDKDYRSTIDELIALYILEPELRDIYVEGSTVKASVDWFLKWLGCKSVTIFEIDSVNIPSSLVSDYALNPGNRDELIVLSEEFKRLLENDAKYLLCIADSDFDFLLGRKYYSRYLIYSEYTSTDLCFCSEDALEKLFILGVRSLPYNIEKLIDNFAEVLQEVFLIRTANEKMGWCMEWIDFCHCCRTKDNLVIFDSKEFIKRYLSKNQRRGEIKEFTSVCEELRSIKVETFKHRIRCHDLFNLLGWYISKKVGRGGNKYRDPEVIRTAIVTAANVELVIDKEPFRTLSKIYKS